MPFTPFVESVPLRPKTTPRTPVKSKAFSPFVDAPAAREEEDGQDVAAPKSLLSTVTSPLSAVLDTVGTTGRMTAAGVGDSLQGKNPLPRMAANRPKWMGGTREDSFSEVLKEQGMPEGKTRDILGLAGDVVVDPLNLLGVGAVKNLLKGTSKALKLGDAATAAWTAAKKVPHVEELVEGAAKAFVPFHGLDQHVARQTAEEIAAGEKALTYKDVARLNDSTLQAKFESGAADTSKVFTGKLSKDEAFNIANAIDKGETLANPAHEALKVETKRLLDAQFNEEIAAGLMKPEQKIDNYITYLLQHSPDEGATYKSLSGKNRFALERETPTLEDAVAKGAEGDVRTILATRLGVGRKAVATNNFFLDVTKKFGSKDAQSGWRTVKLAAETPLKNSVKGVYFPPEIADHLEKIATIPEEATKWDKAFTATTALWKGYATRANFGFHLRNHISNMANNWLGGMSLHEMPQLYMEAKGWEKAPTAIGTHSPEAIAKALDEYGVVGGHHTAFNELQHSVDPITTGQKVNPFSKHNALLELGGRWGSSIEGVSRKALFFDQLHKGKSLEEAALHVRKYLFDYSELTDTEKKIRKVVPFYTWARKNVPLQIEAVLTQPHKVAAQGKVFNSLEKATQEDGIRIPNADRPDYMNETGYVQLPTKTSTGAGLLVNPSLPIQDLNRLDDINLLKDGGGNLLSNLNPMLRVPIELMMNKEAFTGRPIFNPMTGATGLKKANPLSETLQKMGLGGVVGAVPTTRGVEQPAMVDYALRQFPITSTLGRIVATDDVAKGGDLFGVPHFTSNVANFAGLSNKTVTGEQRRTTVKQHTKDAKASKTAKRNEKARIRKSDNDSWIAQFRNSFK